MCIRDRLQRLDTEYVDFYLLHCLDKEKWQTVLDLNLIPYFEELKAQGKIRFFGFSFHDDFEVFEQIATYRKWDFCQIQYNYVDTDIQAGEMCIRDSPFTVFISLFSNHFDTYFSSF